MDSLKNIFNNYELAEREVQKAAYYHWQELALEALKYLEQPKRSVVFKWFKMKEQKATIALRYMQEKNIKNFYYMAKLMNL